MKKESNIELTESMLLRIQEQRWRRFRQWGVFFANNLKTKHLFRSKEIKLIRDTKREIAELRQHQRN